MSSAPHVALDAWQTSSVLPEPGVEDFEINVLKRYYGRPPSVEHYPWGGFQGRKLVMVGKSRRALTGIFEDVVVRRRRSA